MNLQQWQKEKTISNAELAEFIGVHVSYLSHLRKGRRKVSPELALKIEELTDGAVDKLELLYPSKEPVDKTATANPDTEHVKGTED